MPQYNLIVSKLFITFIKITHDLFYLCYLKLIINLIGFLSHVIFGIRIMSVKQNIKDIEETGYGFFIHKAGNNSNIIY